MPETRKLEMFRPRWWEIAEMLMLARHRAARTGDHSAHAGQVPISNGTPSDIDVRLACAIISERLTGLRAEASRVRA